MSKAARKRATLMNLTRFLERSANKVVRLDDFTVHLLSIRRKFIRETGVNRYTRKYAKCTATFAYIVEHSRGQKEVTSQFLCVCVCVSCWAAHPSSGSPHLAFLSLSFCVKRDECVALYFPEDPAAPSFLQLRVKISCSPVVLIRPLSVRGPFSSRGNFQKSEGPFLYFPYVHCIQIVLFFLFNVLIFDVFR